MPPKKAPQSCKKKTSQKQPLKKGIARKKIVAQSKVPKGYIIRRGYEKKTKTGKTICIEPALIKDRGLPGKGPKLIPELKKGMLTSYGYSANDSAQKRHQSIKESAKHNDPLAIFRGLLAVSTLNKNTSPGSSKNLKADANWVKKTYIK